MEPCRTEIDIIKITFHGYNIVFVETPGFDNTKRTDSDILKMTSAWLEITYAKFPNAPKMQLICRGF